MRFELEAFVIASNSSSDNKPQMVEQVDVPVTAPQESVAQKGSRSVGWRLRYLVLKRDRFYCQACGRSPAIEPGTILHVDHIVPWSLNGLTVESNLQTLCDRCNVGKGAA